MRKTGPLLAAAVWLCACGGAPSASSHSPRPTATPATSASATASPTGAPGPPSLLTCTSPVPAGDNLVIGTVAGNPTVVLRDIQDPANAKNLCSFDNNTLNPQFVSASTVAYETANQQIIEANIATGATTVMATYTSGPGSGQFAISPDGRSVTYLDGDSWHLAGPSGNRVLTALPPVPDRGLNPDQDDSYLGYSPDGLYIAFFQTVRTGGPGAAAPDQVRRASDGGVVYSTSGMTMAVWASVPSRLYFRDGAGKLRRWDPSTGASALNSTVLWVRPRASPDGRWIAYSAPTGNGLHDVALYSVQADQVTDNTLTGRSGVRFLNNDLLFYIGERACTNCLAPEPTGVSYIYDIAGRGEVISRLSSVNDAWPHTSA